MEEVEMKETSLVTIFWYFSCFQAILFIGKSCFSNFANRNVWTCRLFYLFKKYINLFYKLQDSKQIKEERKNIMEHRHKITEALISVSLTVSSPEGVTYSSITKSLQVINLKKYVNACFPLKVKMYILNSHSTLTKGLIL